MRAVQTGPVAGLIALPTLLAALAGTVGLDGSGWAVGAACGVVLNASLACGLTRSGAPGVGPADWVTLTRATLVCGVAALVADSFGGAAAASALVALVSLSTVALTLDAVDGWVARRTGTASPLGARFDLETDAFLILVLSVYVARELGPWVLAIGAVRYAFVAAGWLLPWLRGSLPARYWRKVVAATQGVVLTVAAADVLAPRAATAALAISLVLLAESFGRDVGWLWHRRELGAAGEGSAHQARDDHSPVRAGARGRARTAASWVLGLVASALVWFALVGPNDLNELSPRAFLRLPLEGLVVVALLLVLPRRARTAVAVLAGLVFGVLSIVKLLDMGFLEALGREFDVVIDWRYFGSAVSLLIDSAGRPAAVAALVIVGVVVGAALVLLPVAMVRLTRFVHRHRATSLRTVAALGCVWALFAVLDLNLAPGAPLASAGAATLAYDHVREIPAEIRDQQRFARAAAVDPLKDLPAGELLTGLRGKDVLIVFVESYGRVAVQDSKLSAGVNDVLDSGTARLAAAGYSSRSAFLTSPTFGAVSWLAHATLQSGLWVDSQRRYDVLVANDRFTLSDAFKRAGWRTVGAVPSNDRDWPQGAFYDYDKLYDSRNVGYAGPKFGYSRMPDQFALAAFQRLELADRDRLPLLAEIDLASSHAPWAPLPRMVGWDDLGDGSVYDGMPAEGRSREYVWRYPSRVQTAYGQSIEYTWSALVSFLETYPDPDLVLVVLGDHQPARIVSGENPSHDVPVTIIARDPQVLVPISRWGWQDGLRPRPDAPVWPMDAFRDRFLTAYGPNPPPPAAPVAARGASH